MSTKQSQSHQLSIYLRGSAHPIIVVGDKTILTEFIDDVWTSMSPVLRLEGFKAIPMLSGFDLSPFRLVVNTGEIAATTVEKCDLQFLNKEEVIVLDPSTIERNSS